MKAAAILLIMGIWLAQASYPLKAEEATKPVSFTHFSLRLPPKWSGDEQIGFISDNPAEYALTLAHKDETEENFVSQVSIYLLPNKPGVTAEKAAQTLKEVQGEPSVPVLNGNFWEFEGEPRSNTVKGRGVTMVNADPEFLLIIISQDSNALGAKEIIESLRGITPEAKRLLGR